MSSYQAIIGHEQVLAHFGMWPSFHDAEVHRIILERTERTEAGREIPTLELTLHGWVSGPSSLQERQAIVRFFFEDVFDVQLEGFNGQNVLSSLNLHSLTDAESKQALLQVELEHCYVFSAEFKARRASVLSVVPYQNPADA